MNINQIKKSFSFIVAVAVFATPFVGYAQSDSLYMNLVQPPAPTDNSIPSAAGAGNTNNTTFNPDTSLTPPPPNYQSPTLDTSNPTTNQSSLPGNNYINTFAPSNTSAPATNNSIPSAAGASQYNVPAGYNSFTGGSASTPTNPSTPSAPAANNGNVVALKSPLTGVNSVSDLIFTFMKIISYLAVIFGVIMLMWVGLQLVLAQGKPEEIKKRSNELLWVVVGIGVILGARIIVTTVINTLQSTGTVNQSIINNANKAINSQ